MNTFIVNMLADLGVSADSLLTPTHIIILFFIVMGLSFVADLIHALMSIGKGVGRF